ncbi:MAG: sugar phosphate isomerase/epimerase [Anaerolineae bacterium]|nr:sugar phosphate isomerase/epimerase [Anaerolineae bacterium]
MNLSVCAWSFEVLPLDGALAICRALGFDRVALSAFHNRGHASYEPDELGANPQKAADDLLPRLDKYGFQVVDLFVQFNDSFYGRSMNEPDPAIRQKNIESFKGIVRFCQLTNIPGITLLPGMAHVEASFEQNMDIAGETYRQLIAIAQPAGIEVRFEPHMQSLTDTPERAQMLIERAPGLKVTLDYSHFVLQYVDVERIHKLIPHTGFVHVRQARPGKLQTRHAEGTIDFADIIKRLKAVNYQGSFGLEYVCGGWFDCNQQDTITETLESTRALEAALA